MSEPQKEPTPSAETVRAQDQERLRSLQAAFPGDPGFVLEQYTAGATVVEAKAARLDVIEAQLADERKAREAAEKKAAAKPEPKPIGVSPVRQGGGAGAHVNDPRTAFLARVKELQAEGHSPNRAVSIAVGEDPERHMAFVESAPANGSRSARQALDRIRDLHGVERREE